MDQPQAGDTYPIHIGWQLPDATRLEVTFRVQVEGVELDKNRIRCRLLQIQAASGNRPESEVDPRYFEHLMRLIGKQAALPLDALQGVVLPLRLATLTGEHTFFSE
jgi:hypothetical protein